MATGVVLIVALVAPGAGAWIETIAIVIDSHGLEPSPPARGRGLKRLQSTNYCLCSRRPRRGGVD